MLVVILAVLSMAAGQVYRDEYRIPSSFCIAVFSDDQAAHLLIYTLSDLQCLFQNRFMG